MKIALLAAMAALMNAQAPVAAKAEKPVETVAPKTPTEYVFSEDESLKLENAMLRVALLQKEYKIDEYSGKVAPLSSLQREIVAAACLKVGVPADKMQTECGFAGFANDGSPVIGSDGKPVPRRVWHHLLDQKK
jgi:hypothetical protein